MATGLKGSFASTATRLAVLSISLGVAVLIVSFCILRGFQEKIRDKIFNFDSHIQVSSFDLNASFEGPPISINSNLYKNARTIDGVKNISSIAYQKGILHANEQVYGVMMKGIGLDYDSSLFSPNLTSGHFLRFDTTNYSRDIIVSDKIAGQLGLAVDEPLFMYFYIEGKLRPKKVTLVGTYATGMEEFDDRVAIVDLRMIQQINNWPDTLVGGYEIFLNDYHQLDRVAGEVEYMMDYDTQLIKITDKFHYIFDWLDVLLADNVNVLIGAIVIIVFFNIISTMYILLMERTPMVGLLKALGATNGLVHRIFMNLGIKILLKGLLFGNGAGLLICAIQYFTHIIPLEPETYYMEYVPVKWDVESIVLINFATVLFVVLVLVIPLFIITKIAPVKAIKFN